MKAMKNLKRININLYRQIVMIVFAIIVIIFLTGKLLFPQVDSVLILATTTSTYDSGLLDNIIPTFTDAEVQIISVGTGQALKIGEEGNADILLIHAPDSENKFMANGYGEKRSCVMYNDFVILGPMSDPASIKEQSITDALKLIMQNNVEFISRGDDSGTHKKELKLWTAANVENTFENYLEVGQGMGDTIRIANEKQAYTLADRGTYLSQKDNIDLVVLVEGDEILLNQYGVIIIDSSENKDIANSFFDWLLSENTQQKISDFKKNGEQLFKPLNGKCILG